MVFFKRTLAHCSLQSGVNIGNLNYCTVEIIGINLLIVNWLQ